MRIFQKPKPNGKMEVSEDIFRNPAELEALKVKVKPEEYLKTLYDKIFFKEQELETLTIDAQSKKETLERDYEEDRARKNKEIDSLEDVLGIKRAEYAELIKPSIDRSKELDTREAVFAEKELLCKENEQTVFERERNVENRLQDLQLLSDKLGDIKIQQENEKTVLGTRETLLKEKEIQYLAKIDHFSAEVNKAATLTQERGNELSLRELNLQGKEENLAQREARLIKDNILLNDQRGVLKRAFEELQRKQTN